LNKTLWSFSTNLGANEKAAQLAEESWQAKAAPRASVWQQDSCFIHQELWKLQERLSKEAAASRLGMTHALKI
jgi:hypothetical protein